MTDREKRKTEALSQLFACSSEYDIVIYSGLDIFYQLPTWEYREQGHYIMI